MVQLTSEEREALKELIGISQSQESVSEFINNRLYKELSIDQGQDEEGNCHITRKDGFADQLELYLGLYKKDLLTAKQPSARQSSYRFGNLTSTGRCYFQMEEEQIEKRKKEQEEERRYARHQAFIAFAASAVLTLLINAQSIASNLNWIRGFFLPS